MNMDLKLLQVKEIIATAPNWTRAKLNGTRGRANGQNHRKLKRDPSQSRKNFIEIILIFFPFIEYKQSEVNSREVF